MGRESKAKQQRGIEKHQTTYTTSQVREKLLAVEALDDLIWKAQCDVECELTYIMAVVIAGIEANSFSLISKMLTGRAGALSKAVVNYREAHEKIKDGIERDYNLVYELIEVTKQAANGDCKPIIQFTKLHGNEAVAALIGGREIRRKRDALEQSKAQAKRVEDLLTKGYNRTYAIQLTAEEFNSGFSAVEKNYGRYRSDT